MRISGWMVENSEQGDGVKALPLGCSFGCSESDWQGGECQLGLAVWDHAGAKGRAGRPRHVWEVLQLCACLLLWEASDRHMQGGGHPGSRARSWAGSSPIPHLG